MTNNMDRWGRLLIVGWILVSGAALWGKEPTRKTVPAAQAETYLSPLFSLGQTERSPEQPAARTAERPERPAIYRNQATSLGDPYAGSETMQGYVGLATLLEDHAPLPVPKLAQRPGNVDLGTLPAEGLPPGAEVFSDQPVGPLEQYVFEEDPNAPPLGRISPYKSGFFQKLALTGTWLANGSNQDDLGMTEIESAVTVAVPFPIREWPMLITPAFNIRLLQGPRVTDLPSRLYETYVDFMWVPQFLPRLRGLVAVTPSYYSDFQRGDSQAFRIQGKALAIYDFVPDRLQIVAGLLYLGRDDVVMLPAGGVIWTPTDWVRWELIFPRPKLATRFNQGYGFEDWLYITCEWGGNTYSIERTNGTGEHVTWQDFRLLAGVERNMNGGAGYRVEAGYVIGRSVRYGSGVGDFDPDNTWLIRGGVTF
jgi:hypothetical protein